jgi:hypothetical protein
VATFNPNVPDQPVPNFEQLARPSYYTPKSDESGAILGKGVGEALNLGAHALDAAFKQGISSDLHDQVDTQRDAFSSALGTVREAQKSGASLSLLDQKDADPTLVPPTIDSGIKGAQTVQAAFSGKKISETYYYQQLDSITQGMRSRFPGYRDYIDEKMKEITGVNPANAYMRSLITDIQNSNAGKDAIRNKVISDGLELVKTGAPIAPELNNFINGDITQEQFINKMNAVNADKFAYTRAKTRAETQVAIEGASAKDSEFRFKPVLNQYVDGLATQSVDTIFSGGGVHSMNDILNVAQRQAEGKVSIDPQQWSMWDEQMQAARTRLFNQGMAEANKHEAGELSMADRVGGPEAAATIVNARLDQTFGPVHKMITDKDFGSGVFLANQMKNMKESDQWQTFNDPVLGQTARKLDSLKSILPGPAFQTLETNELLKPSTLNYMTKTFKLNVFAQPANINPDGTPFTHSQGVAAIIKQPGTTAEDHKDFLKTINYINDPKTSDQVKLNIAKAAFDPSDVNLLEKVGASPQQKLALFTQFTTPQTAHEMWRLGQSDPTVWQNYKNWTEESFATQVFSKELTGLQDIQKMPWLKLGWDSDHNMFVTKSSPSAASGAYSGEYDLIRARQALSRINAAITSISAISNQDGSDTSAFILNILQNGGVDLSNVDGIPSHMAAAIRAARPKPLDKKE